MQNISTRKDMMITMNNKVNKNISPSLQSCESQKNSKTPARDVEITREKGQYILFLKSKKGEGKKAT